MASTLSWTFLPLCDDGSDPLQGLRARKESVVRMADLADGGQSEGKMATLRLGPCDDIRNRSRQRRVERGNATVEWAAEALQEEARRCRDPDFRVPGAPHTSGSFFE